MPMLFINPYRSDGGRNLLDQCKSHFAVAGIGLIDKFFRVEPRSPLEFQVAF